LIALGDLVNAKDSRLGGGAVTKCILIVDDNAAIRKGLRNVIESAENSWSVCGEASDGREGVRKAQELKPDLVVLDLSMPVMNGLEAARVLSQEMPNLPVIMCSLHTNRILEEEASAAGIRSIVSKSQSMNVLVSKVHALLESD
jgi:two-component system nitrate/nitrite response regulator NarL